MKDIVDFVLKNKYKGIIDHKLNMMVYENKIYINLDTSNRYWYAKSKNIIKDIRREFSNVDVRREQSRIVIERR